MQQQLIKMLIIQRMQPARMHMKHHKLRVEKIFDSSEREKIYLSRKTPDETESRQGSKPGVFFRMKE